MDILSIILLDYRKSAKECSKKLEYEENNNNVASLQGELSACKLFLDTFKNGFSSSSFYDEVGNIDDQYLPKFDKVTDKEITDLEIQRIQLEKDQGFEKFLQVFDRAIESKKEWLFHSAEKGRDLVKVHGWRDGLKKHETIMNQVEAEYELRAEDNQLFTDDLDISEEKEVNPNIILLEFNESLFIEDKTDSNIIDVEPEEVE